MTELYVALNTENCDVGRTSRARISSLAGLSGDALPQALRMLPNLNLNHKGKWNRHVETVKYWGMRNIYLIPNDHSPNPLQETKDSILAAITEHGARHIRAFTDGSTDPKSKQCISGLGIALFDEKKEQIWQGGAPIRADGNNFVAEAAAAALVLDAVPPTATLQLHIDSTATIGAIQKGRLSERRNIRSAARNWVNLAKSAASRRATPVDVVHVRSHQGEATFEEKGNSLADQLANEARLEHVDEQHPYFTEGDIQILLKHEERLILQDTRLYLKKIELQEMKAEWVSLKRQSVNFMQHPQTLLKLAKKVTRWAIAENNPQMWSYFMLAALQWLPTKCRKLVNQNKDTTCRLCLQGKLDDLEHMTCCPALNNEHEQVKNAFIGTLASWKILPLHKGVRSDRLSSSLRWPHMCQAYLTSKGKAAPSLRTLTGGKLLRGNGRAQGLAQFSNRS